MRVISKLRRMLGVGLSHADAEQIKQSVTDAGYYEEVSVRYSTAQTVFILLLAVFLVVSLVTNGALLSADNLIYFAKDMSMSVSMQERVARDTLTYTALTDATHALFREGLAVLSREKLTVFTATGREAFTDQVSFATPRLQSSGRYLAAYDLGGYSYRLYNSFSCVQKQTLSTPIRAMATASSGAYCVATDGVDTTSLVTLYNERFDAVNLYHINEYVSCVDLSKEGQLLIGAVSSQNGRLTTHLMTATPGKEQADATWTVSDAYPVWLGFTDSGRILLLTTDAAVWFNANGKELARHTFSSDGLRDYYVGEQGCVLLSRANAYDQSLTVEAFDKNGKQQYSFATQQAVKDVVLTDNVLGILTDESLLLYRNGKDEAVDTISFQGDYDTLLACDTDEFLLCNASKAIVVRSDKTGN